MGPREVRTRCTTAAWATASSWVGSNDNACSGYIFVGAEIRPIAVRSGQLGRGTIAGGAARGPDRQGDSPRL